MADKTDLGELGTTGLRRSGGFINEEFLPSLRGRRGSLVWREMQDNDPVVGSILFAIDKVVTRLEWRVEAQEDGDEDVAEFVDSCIHDMSESWNSTLSGMLSFLVFGWSFHEIVYKKRDGQSKDSSKRSKFSDGKIGWRKFAIRAQETLNDWMVDPDSGGIIGMRQMDPSGFGLNEIPMEKGLLFRTTTQKGNPEGRSLLRNAYRPWYFKKRIEEIEAIGIERDLAGLPVAYVPPEYLSSNANADQVAVLGAVQDIVRNVKRNEQEGVVFPVVYDDAGHKMFELTLLSTGGQRQFDTDKVITRYDSRIAMSVLADFILLGHDRVGSFALGSSKIDLWTMSVDAIAKSIAEVINQHAIPRLLRLNGMDDANPPLLSFGEVAHVDLQELGDFVQKLTAAGILTPDAKLEEYLRQSAGLPHAEHEGDYGDQVPMPGKEVAPDPAANAEKDPQQDPTEDPNVADSKA